MTIYFHYLHLLGQVGNGAGDMAGNPGFKPTDQSKEFHAILKRRLDDALGKLKTLLDNDVARFNQPTGAQVGVSAKQKLDPGGGPKVMAALPPGCPSPKPQWMSPCGGAA